LEIAELPKSTYFYWISKEDTPEDPLVELIREIVTTHRGRYGYRRVVLELHHRGFRVNHKKVLRIMRENGLLCTKFRQRNRRYKSYRGTVGTIAKNELRRRFQTDRPFQKLLTDVSEMRYEGGKLYISPVLDCCGGYILSCSIHTNPTLEFARASLERALEKRPALPYRTMVHSDQGWHYQHRSWRKILKQNRARQSMSRKGNCLDNARMENFFGILKQEMYYGESFANYEELETAIKDYIYYYNHQRRSQKLNGMTPEEFRNHSVQIMRSN
jgi:transposase InsO family protein